MTLTGLILLVTAAGLLGLAGAALADRGGKQAAAASKAARKPIVTDRTSTDA